MSADRLVGYLSPTYDAPVWSGDVAQEVMALWIASQTKLGSVAGTANAITAAATPTIPAYASDQKFTLIPATTNTAAVTINIDSRGVLDLVDADGVALLAGALVAGRAYGIWHDSSKFRVIAGGAGSTGGGMRAPDLIIHDEKASGTAAGASSTLAVERTLNAVKRNVLAGASADGVTRFTLPAGSFLIAFEAPAASCNGHQAWLQNVTDAVPVTAGMGSSEFAWQTDQSNSFSTGLVPVTIGTSKTFAVLHKTGFVRATFGLGQASGLGNSEVFTRVRVWQIGATDSQVKGIPGGPIAFKMLLSTTTADADPGASTLRLNNATQNTATQAFVDLLDYALVDLTALIDNNFSASTNAVRGVLSIFKDGDPSKFLVFNVTSLTSVAGYRKLAITNVASSAASPFANGDLLVLQFARTGDRGDVGTFGFDYTWSTSTAATDPTAGKLKVNNATPASATALYISETEGHAIDVSTELARWDDGTSTVKGRLRIVHRTNSAKWLELKVTGTLTDNGAWDTFTVTQGIAGTALADGDPVSVTFIPTGDKGNAGGAMELILSQSVSAVTTIEFINGTSGVAFDDTTYDRWVLLIDDLKVGTDDKDIRLEIGTGATPTWQTGAGAYKWSLRLIDSDTASFDERSASAVGIWLTQTATAAYSLGNASGESLSGRIEFTNPEVANFPMFMIDTVYDTSNDHITRATGAGRYNTAAAITAVRLAAESAATLTGRVSLYGIKKA